MDGVLEIQQAMESNGFWMLLKSSFEPGGDWICGFTPHGTSGWNGAPDFEGFGKTAIEAATNAFAVYQGRVEEGYSCVVDRQ